MQLEEINHRGESLMVCWVCAEAGSMTWGDRIEESEAGDYLQNSAFWYSEKLRKRINKRMSYRIEIKQASVVPRFMSHKLYWPKQWRFKARS